MASPRIVFWTHTTRLSVASYRIRCAQVRRALAGEGVRTGLWSGKRVPSGAPDLLILSKLTRPEALERALAIKGGRGTRLVLDLCDNVFFEPPEQDAAGRARLGALVAALDGFDAIVTPSPYLDGVVARALRGGTRRVIIPDAVEEVPRPRLATRLIEARAFRALAAFRAEAAAQRVDDGRRLIWFGTSGTRKARNGLQDLEAHAGMLERHAAEAPLSLTVVSDSRERFAETIGRVPVAARYVAWNYWTFGEVLRAHDVAILPVRANAYNLAKSANRLTTAFAHGVAVAASAIPSYEPFRGCAVLDDWDAGLGGLMRARAERAARVAAAAPILAADYALPAVTRAWRALFSELGAG